MVLTTLNLGLNNDLLWTMVNDDPTVHNHGLLMVMRAWAGAQSIMVQGFRPRPLKNAFIQSWTKHWFAASCFCIDMHLYWFAVYARIYLCCICVFYLKDTSTPCRRVFFPLCGLARLAGSANARIGFLIPVLMISILPRSSTINKFSHKQYQ